MPARRSRRVADPLLVDTFPFTEEREVDGLLTLIPDPPHSHLRSSTRNFVTAHLMRTEYKLHTGKPKCKSLAPLLQLPEDIVLEVIARLRVIDLYHMSLVSKAMRRIVMSDSMRPAWKRGFSTEHLIAPHPSISEPRWASLLFGPLVCGDCGRRGAAVDYVNLVRICRRCWLIYYVAPNEDRPEEGIYPMRHVVWTLLPTTTRAKGGQIEAYMHYSKPMYRKSAVIEMAEKVDAYQASIDAGKPGANQAYYTFVKEAQAHAQSVNKFGKKCTTWSQKIIRALDAQNMGLHERLVMTAKNIFNLADRHSDDVSVGAYVCVQRARPNTLSLVHFEHSTRAWKKMGPCLYECIDQAKKNRIEFELRTRVEEVKSKVGPIYKDRVTDEQSKSWLEYPPLHEVLRLPGLTSLMEGELGKGALKAYCRKQFHNLPEFSRSWKAGLLSDLVVMLPADQNNLSPDVRLELATSVFTCSGCSDRSVYRNHRWLEGERVTYPWQGTLAFIGWIDISGHLGCPTMEVVRRLVYSPAGSDAVRALAAILGLNPVTLSVHELDETNHRYVCTNCPIGPTGRRGQRGHKAFTWRECVFHYVECKQDAIEGHDQPAWRRLSVEMVEYLEWREVPVPLKTSRVWNCCHCCVFYEAYEVLDVVLHHLDVRHEIDDPQLDVDYFLYQRTARASRVPVGISEHPTLAELYCLHCGSYPTRLWAQRSIIPHLLDKHQINEPVLDLDYHHFSVFEDV